jgi:hypothetical protein
LNSALQDKTWDASIQVLCHFPDVLFSMSDKLDQTRQLGDAFLIQREDVMAMIQELRQKAADQGNLKTTKEQTVIEDKYGIRIEPADPVIVYVPVYDPLYVYGPWWYPAYPPYYWYYPPGVIITGGYISFGVGFFVGVDVFSWYWFDWPRHIIHIDRYREGRFVHIDHKRRGFSVPYWRHEPYHRRGVAYRDRHTAERFGVKPFRRQAISPEMRGYPERKYRGPAVSPSPRHSERREGAPETRRRMERPEVRGTRERNVPFWGIGSGSFERRASERGGMSRQRANEFRREGDRDQRGGNTDRDGESRDRRRGGGFRR